jgi:glycosyltransferase involved in cell wall biosynthesis
MTAVSLVTTVLNDREGVELFLRRMATQTTSPTEIVVVDGGSTDGTWELLKTEAKREDRSWRLKVFQEKGCNVARGRNLAIKATSYEIIASTDVGCDWDPQWFEELVAPLEARSTVELVAGSWEVRERDLEGPWAKTEFALRGTVMRTSAAPTTMPSSRSVAYRREVWERLGGYPEDLTLAGDDMVFDILYTAHKVRAAAAPTIRCYWYRHTSLKGFLKEQHRYFVGNGEAGIAMSYFVLVGGRLLLEAICLLAGAALALISPIRWMGVALFGIACVSLMLRLWRWLPASRRLATMCVDWPLARVAAFETLCRCYALSGYIRGLRRGARKCHETRQRLKEAHCI